MRKDMKKLFFILTTIALHLQAAEDKAYCFKTIFNASFEAVTKATPEKEVVYLECLKEIPASQTYVSRSKTNPLLAPDYYADRLVCSKSFSGLSQCHNTILNRPTNGNPKPVIRSRKIHYSLEPEPVMRDGKILHSCDAEPIWKRISFKGERADAVYTALEKIYKLQFESQKS